MEKFFNQLAKPAKLVYVIGAFLYALLFAILTAAGIGGTFMSVTTNLIILIVGTALLVAAPIFILLDKNEPAKVVFLILLGYFVLSNILNYFGLAEARVVKDADGGVIAQGIFDFLLGLALASILVLIALEFMFKKPIFRFVAFFIMLGIILVALVTFIIALVNCIRFEAGWTGYLNIIMLYLLPAPVLFFGYLYFFGAPAKK